MPRAEAADREEMLDNPPFFSYLACVTADLFRPEISEALRSYDRHVVCLDKTLDECEDAILRLMEKAIRAFENRGPNLRHGIALDGHITIILSQTDQERPLCGIYFNLHSPYRKPAARAKTAAASSHP